MTATTPVGAPRTVEPVREPSDPAPMTVTTVRPGAVVRLRDGTFGVVLQRNTRSVDLLAVDVWHAGAVLVRRKDVVAVVVPEPEEPTLPAGTA